MKTSKKHIYKMIDVKDVRLEKLAEQVKGKRICVGIDVAKEKFVLVLMNEAGEVWITIKWKHPTETRQVVAFLQQLPTTAIEVALEPTGTYGDALRVLFWQEGFRVYRVNPKSVHHSAEIYDNVPSLHDAKAAAIIAQLHLDGHSHLWPLDTDDARRLAASLSRLDLYDDPFQRNLNRLEALLARHWPEVTQWLDLDSATLLTLLGRFGSPAFVHEQAEAAGQLMRMWWDQ